MKTKKSLRAILFATAFISLASFVAPLGGEGFQVLIDNKVVLEKFHHELKRPTNLQLNRYNAKSQLEVKFYHCGMVGKHRILRLKDANKKLLKQWEFTNAAGKNFAVTVPVKELLSYQEKNGSATLYLYYSSKEASEGRLLTGLVQAKPNSKSAK